MSDITANFHRGNRESRDAHALSRRTAARDRERIAIVAKRRGQYGITCDEAERLLSLSHQTCSARFSEMKRDGVLEPTSVTRKTRNGAQARVMVLSEAEVASC